MDPIVVKRFEYRAIETIFIDYAKKCHNFARNKIMIAAGVDLGPDARVLIDVGLNWIALPITSHNKTMDELRGMVKMMCAAVETYRLLCKYDEQYGPRAVFGNLCDAFLLDDSKTDAISRKD